MPRLQLCKYFAGERRILCVYVDRLCEIGQSVQVLGIMPQSRQPGMPQESDVAERANGVVREEARSALLEAGLPSYVLGYAITHCFFLKCVQ